MIIFLLFCGSLFLKEAFHFHLPTWHYEATERWFDSGRARCQIRKRPWLQLTDRGLKVSWETNCAAQKVLLSWGCNGSEKKADILKYYEIDQTHHLYYGYISGCAEGVYKIAGSMNDVSFSEKHPFFANTSSPTLRIAIFGNSAENTFQFRKLIKNFPAHDMILHLGGMVSKPMDWKEWTIKLLSPLKFHLRNKPLISVPAEGDVIIGGYNPYFLPKDDGDGYWATPLGPAGLIILNTNRVDREQTAWLEHELSSQNVLKIVAVNTPLNAKAKWLMEQHWTPLFLKHRPDVVLGNSNDQSRCGALIEFGDAEMVVKRIDSSGKILTISSTKVK